MAELASTRGPAPYRGSRSGRASPVLAEVVRSGFVESLHRGRYVVLAADGEVAASAGDVDAPVFPRSANKPAQAAAMVECGVGLGGELLALAAASHSGEDFHVAGVRRILDSAGLDEAALGCPPALPLDESAAYAALRGGERPQRALMNCSGKHAAMLATCVANGWPTAAYREPEHPLQRAIRATVERLAGEPVAATGVDGCGAPVLALTLAGLAETYRRAVLAAPGTAERSVADAMRANPAWCSGTRRDERLLMDRVPGLLVKAGAEGVKAFAMPDGRAGAVKIEDGAARATTPVVVALLHHLGVTDGGLDDLAAVPVLGGGEPVGEIRVADLPQPTDHEPTS